MGVLSVIQIIVMLLQGVFSALGKAGLAAEAAGVQAAITSLESVQGTLVTKAEVDSFKISPQW